MILPANSGILASVRESVRRYWRYFLICIGEGACRCGYVPAQFAQAMLVAMYVFCAPPNHRAIFVVSSMAITILTIGLIDRGIEVRPPPAASPQAAATVQKIRPLCPHRSASTTASSTGSTSSQWCAEAEDGARLRGVGSESPTRLCADRAGPDCALLYVPAGDVAGAVRLVLVLRVRLPRE